MPQLAKGGVGGAGLAGSNHVNALTYTDRFAVQRGYWRDDFIQHFCRSVEKKSPEISRGRSKCAHLHMYVCTSSLVWTPDPSGHARKGLGCRLHHHYLPSSLSPTPHMTHTHTHMHRLLCPCQKHTCNN